MLRPYNVGEGNGGAVRAPERAQVQHAALWCAEECVRDREPAGVGLSGLAGPHDAASFVDRVGTTGAPAEGPQVHHAATGGPQKRVTAAAHDLGPVVDPERHARGAQGPEIAHPVGRRPHERARRAGLGLGQADRFAAVVQVVRDARRSAQTAEVDHRAGFGNDEGVLRCRARAAAAAMPRHLPAPVDSERLALVSAEGAEIEARARRQEVGVEVAEASVSTAHDFAVVVDVVGRGVHAGERLQIDDRQVLLPQERPRPAEAVAARAHDLTAPVHGLRLAHRATQRAELANRNYRRPSCLEAHRPAWTAVSAVGPSKRCTRLAARPSRLTATMWKIETWPSAGLYRSRNCAPPASPAEPSAIAGRARAL